MTATKARRAPVLQSACRAGVLGVAPALTVLLAAPAQSAAPTPGNVQPPGTEGLTTMLGWGGWLVSFVCVAGILIVAAMMALKHRRGEGGGEAMGALGWVLGACVLGSAAGPLANALI
jgi:uncharacterized membrane protein HdeD (DUF308 family)